ncbi:N-acetyl-alpha-D-glucosaminyl-diphospho-ditrans,octacis-undecaprenol 4-epimerase [Koleobacter methoxysyntrophicus]|uniref:N-acetyl-alpha-D-glucosaminyl-diphospho-ditrans, octacis-undecaprenol 4-epimerase n=1 Tax=Koleobacter methoxysyntrophicus TaxID=2751313 RepID=A0A8A0RIB7_9FIRM|nr:NAD-dependent epimerase/dehydratase family protein [Koleobacter methoxysyntrophicus]QSQ07963.1 N-acetyl-alpha-D-glucosaminyl-diphospho-ditrans,octacis-undecaprenol 4-epimerase [Koleobacter methoxysyntrophicus]
MKKILITGANSYIGTSFEKWILQYPDKYSMDTIDMRDEGWREKSFRGYDVVFHVAAIVHVKENDIQKYFKVNRDLTIEVAEKAKREGVKQFIFLSTMGVYGTETGYITKDTIPVPKTPYAKSKYEAEQYLLEMNTDNFNIAILRPPIVYGRGCKGNYPRLAKLALKMPFFPEIENKRSMIYIDNLCEFVRLLIDDCCSGLFFPQNKEYVNTTELVRLIRKSHDKEIKVTKVFNWGIAMGLKFSETFRKVFGSFVYDKGMPGGPRTKINGQIIDYETVTFEESVILTEKNIGD